jgi:prophage regulatory protein
MPQTLATESAPSQTLDVLSPRVVEARLGIDATTIWRMRRRNEFPQPIRLSPGRVGYRRADIEAWIASRGKRS